MINVGLATREHGGHLVITLRGELDIADAPDIAAALARAVATNSWVIADLAALEFIDCCALGVLVQARAQAQRAGGDLLLATPSQQVRRILALSGLIGLFSVRSSVDAAARAAGSPPSNPRLIAQDSAIT